MGLKPGLTFPSHSKYHHITILESLARWSGLGITVLLSLAHLSLSLAHAIARRPSLLPRTQHVLLAPALTRSRREYVEPSNQTTEMTMCRMDAMSALVLTGLLAIAAALTPSCSPGGNFDMSKWSLQLPTGSQGAVTTIQASQLQGCSGFQDFNYFFTESGDGALVMKVPGSPASSGCVTTPNALHCRTELRETNPSSWDPNGPVNRMRILGRHGRRRVHRHRPSAHRRLHL